jgi:flagellar biosynthetic protein FlhB
VAENKDGQDKSEPASAKRLHEARMRGQVSKSMEVTSAALMLIGGAVVFVMGGPIISSVQGFMRHMLRESSKIQISTESITGQYASIIGFIAAILLPLLLLIFAIGLSAEIAQVGLVYSDKKFTEGLNWKQMFNPFSGIKKMLFSGRSVFELVKNLIKLLAMGIVAYQVMSSRSNDVITLMDKPFAEFATLMVSLSLEMIIKIGLLYAILALADYFYQKHKFKEEMKMTKHETKEEFKQTEGDPKIKARIRALMRGRIRKMMLKNVQTSDVVITNPTHYAIAVRYTPGDMNAPIVTAKGVDYLAFQIREIAEEAGIPIVEQPPLARALYANVELEQEIPENLFKAVAQVLAYVYNLKNKYA